MTRLARQRLIGGGCYLPTVLLCVSSQHDVFFSLAAIQLEWLDRPSDLASSSRSSDDAVFATQNDDGRAKKSYLRPLVYFVVNVARYCMSIHWGSSYVAWALRDAEKALTWEDLSVEER